MPIMHTQSLADFNAPRSDKRMPRSRLRRALYRLGYQGTALRSELERITAGPVPLAADGSNLKEAMDAIQARLGDELAAKYPYGWLKSEMTRPCGESSTVRQSLIIAISP